MNATRGTVDWLRGRAKAFDNDVKFLESQRPPQDEQHSGWRESRDRMRAYRIASAELSTVADALERGL